MILCDYMDFAWLKKHLRVVSRPELASKMVRLPQLWATPWRRIRCSIDHPGSAWECLGLVAWWIWTKILPECKMGFIWFHRNPENGRYFTNKLKPPTKKSPALLRAAHLTMSINGHVAEHNRKLSAPNLFSRPARQMYLALPRSRRFSWISCGKPNDTPSPKW